MLLDLTAARLEGKRVPVSSLCIAAAVPTTTALRWIRSLTEAGLLDRYTDPSDARRSHIEIAETAATAMLAYLRVFSAAFALR
jgi:DNA-binding MarR family transcriptional regulator